jgi:hypothetical protein
MAKQIWCARHWALFGGHEGRANWAEARMRLRLLRDPVHGPQVAAKFVKQPPSEYQTVTLPDGRSRRAPLPRPAPTLPAGNFANEVDATHAYLGELGQPLCCIHGDEYMESLLKT